MEVSELRSEMVALFKEVDARFEQVAQQFKQVETRFADLSAQVGSEGEQTRRYFTIALEQMKDERNLVLDQSSGNTKRLDDHERRITALERRK